MLGSWLPTELPGLNPKSCTITSEAAPGYNCVSWAAEDQENFWWPDPWVGYWPEGVSRTVTRGSFIKAFQTLGYQLCLDGSLEQGIEKIAIFGKGPKGVEIPTHAARQLESGEWTSKLGPHEDVRHTTVHAVNGPCYGSPIFFMSRPRSSSGSS